PQRVPGVFEEHSLMQTHTHYFFEDRFTEGAQLLTSAGRDALHAQHLGGASASAQPAQFGYMALADNASATSPASGNTVLAGEITTASGGLIRAQSTYAHTGGTNITTRTKKHT